MPAPELPTWQDCHELWSKQRRRQQREQQEQQGKPKSYGFSQDDKQHEGYQSDTYKSDYKDSFKPETNQETVGQVK